MAQIYQLTETVQFRSRYNCMLQSEEELVEKKETEKLGSIK